MTGRKKDLVNLQSSGDSKPAFATGGGNATVSNNMPKFKSWRKVVTLKTWGLRAILAPLFHKYEACTSTIFGRSYSASHLGS